MNRNKRWITLVVGAATVAMILVAYVFLTHRQIAEAAVIQTASCSQPDVQSAIEAASAGDTVQVPEGNCVWDQPLLIRKGVIIKGAGMEHTIITSNYASLDTNLFNIANYLVAYNPENPADNDMFRLSGFTFDLDGKCRWIMLENRTPLPIDKIRLDHNKVLDYRGMLMHIYGTIYGVADNNLISGPESGGLIRMNGLDATTWNNLAFTYGTAENFYFEDNSFDAPDTMFLYGEMGGRYCIRYNTFAGTGSTNGFYGFADMHGNQPGAHNATMGVEIYENEISCPKGVVILGHRGGKALVFNNDVTSPASVAGPQVREEYHDSINPPASSPITGQPQHVSDSYYWGNTQNGTIPFYAYISDQVDYGGSVGLVPQENGDFWKENPSFDGTTGVGVGLLSARPATCTLGVGYWTTDTRTLYKCTASNTWETYYTPYTYPHPLRNEAVLEGDVNSDGLVDMADIEACVGHILGRQDKGEAADVNKDGDVDVLDVQRIVGIMTGD
jgi:hypothetical protein